MIVHRGLPHDHAQRRAGDIEGLQLSLTQPLRQNLAQSGLPICSTALEIPPAGSYCCSLLTDKCVSSAGVTALVDPWLVGQLTFGGLSWVYAGNKKGPKLDPGAIAASADFMLITQARLFFPNTSLCTLAGNDPLIRLYPVMGSCEATLAKHHMEPERCGEDSVVLSDVVVASNMRTQQHRRLAQPSTVDLGFYPAPTLQTCVIVGWTCMCALRVNRHCLIVEGSAGPRAQADSGGAAP